MTDCALYYGWYAGSVAGPFIQSDFRFVPGAIAVHIHSFSASTLRDPGGGWVGPLLTKGAAASLGNVYEPYLQFTSHLDMFNDRLLHGFTFAESAYMSTRAVSWMSVMVGDPLYRPFASWNQIDLKQEASKTRVVLADGARIHNQEFRQADRGISHARAPRGLARTKLPDDRGPRRAGGAGWKFCLRDQLFPAGAVVLHKA